MPAKPSTPPQVLQMKITLADSKPPIWRRILVGDDSTFYQFHFIIQTVMGWSGAHLHAFQVGGLSLGDPEDDELGSFGTKDERKYKLSKFNFKEGDKFTYEYDFGDGWQHKIVIEKVLPFSADLKIPVCLKGKRACPPEDVGGVWGYEEFLQAIADPNHPEHDSYMEWIDGGEFDPEAFDLDEINAALTIE